MGPKDHYTGKHFKRYARKQFPGQYALFQDLYMCNFENKTYVDANHAAHDVSMLPVGRYRARKNGPPVWAQATGACVKYYRGKAGGVLCIPIPEEHVTRIYCSSAYSSVVGTPIGRSRGVGKKAEHYFAETIVNVFFLLTGRLEQVNNPGKTDMLSNFTYVCMSTMSKPEVQELFSPANIQRSVPNSANDIVERENKRRKRSTHDHGQRIKQEDDTSAAAEHTTNCPGPSSQSSTRPNHSPNHELEQEKRALFDEIQALQAKLDAQELRTQNAEEKLFRERKKRKRAETQIGDLVSQTAMLEERNQSLEIECVGPERHTCRAMIEGQKRDINRIRQSVLKRNETISRLRKELAKED
ncbi:hypothetical protein N0V95_003012 [Ascochyta clinopodiicola]|nr:hypothetical protein N0V95_003012 [Ascochyta clinopodiicola]